MPEGTGDPPASGSAPRPFRFGVHLWQLPADGWAERARRYEDAGFSVLTVTDHQVVPQWDPVATLAAVAAVTTRLRIGSLVFDAALRNPVLLAKETATLEVLSGGRMEVGLGAGYVAANFEAAGTAFEPASARVRRLEETVEVLGRLWREPTTTYAGDQLRLTGAPMALPAPVAPRLLIGGGGRRVLALGGRRADTVSLLPRQTTGTWSPADSLTDSTLGRMAEKASLVAEAAAAAGRPPGSVELNTMVATVLVGPDPSAAVAREAASSGVTPAQMADSTLYLVGTADEACDTLHRWRARTGISYVSLFDPPLETLDYLAEHVVGPLSGR